MSFFPHPYNLSSWNNWLSHLSCQLFPQMLSAQITLQNLGLLRYMDANGLDLDDCEMWEEEDD